METAHNASRTSIWTNKVTVTIWSKIVQKLITLEIVQNVTQDSQCPKSAIVPYCLSTVPELSAIMYVDSAMLNIMSILKTDARSYLRTVLLQVLREIAPNVLRDSMPMSKEIVSHCLTIALYLLHKASVNYAM